MWLLETEDKKTGIDYIAAKNSFAGSSCMEENVAMPGKNIVAPEQNIETKEDCCNACKKRKGCTFFTYRKDMKKCWLKNSDAGRKSERKAFSGSVECCKGNTRSLCSICIPFSIGKLLIQMCPDFHLTMKNFKSGHFQILITDMFKFKLRKPKISSPDASGFLFWASDFHLNFGNIKMQ